MAANTLPIAVGTASANACHAKDLGKTTVLNGITYRIVKAGAAITAAAKKTVVTTVVSGVQSNIVDVTTTAANYLLCGVVPTGQTGSTGTTGLVSGDYFPLIVSGVGIPVLTDAVDIIAGSVVHTGTVPGRVVLGTATLASTNLVRLGISTLSSSASSTTIYVNIDRVL